MRGKENRNAAEDALARPCDSGELSGALATADSRLTCLHQTSRADVRKCYIRRFGTDAERYGGMIAILVEAVLDQVGVIAANRRYFCSTTEPFFAMY